MLAVGTGCRRRGWRRIGSGWRGLWLVPLLTVLVPCSFLVRRRGRRCGCSTVLMRATGYGRRLTLRRSGDLGLKTGLESAADTDQRR